MIAKIEILLNYIQLIFHTNHWLCTQNKSGVTKPDTCTCHGLSTSQKRYLLILLNWILKACFSTKLLMVRNWLSQKDNTLLLTVNIVVCSQTMIFGYQA